MTKFPNVLINVKIINPVKIEENNAIQSAISKAEKTLGKHGRILLRPSGTEPLIRVMVEGDNPDQVNLLAQELAEVVRSQATG